jgi:6-phosphogluconolactonase
MGSNGTPSPEVRVVDDVGALAAAAVELFVEAGPRTIVLSGGTTPEAFYRALAGVAYPWADCEFFFGDERCVLPSDERSNLLMARSALLDRVPARVYPIDGAACDADGYERDLRSRFVGVTLPSFDFAVYGLGPDGHTASLFPGKPAVDERTRWVVGVPEAGLEPFVPRVTMTAPALSAARLGVFLVAGSSKRAALGALLAGEDIPAARMRPSRLVVLCDRAASPE